MFHICESAFLAALNFLLSPVMAGRPPFKLSQLGVRATPKFLSCLPNAYACFAAVAQSSSTCVPGVTGYSTWHIPGKALLLPGRWWGAAGASACTPGDPSSVKLQPRHPGLLKGTLFWWISSPSPPRGLHFACAADHSARSIETYLFVYVCMYAWTYKKSNKAL